MADIVVQLTDGRKAVFPAGTPREEMEAALSALPPPKQGMGTGQYVDNLGRQAAKGATLNAADEIASAADATLAPSKSRVDALRAGLPEWARRLTAPVPTSPTASNAETWNERYTQNLAGNRGNDKAFAAEYPIAATAANVAGALGGGVAMLPASALSATTTGGRVATGMATGAGFGGASEFADAEGDFQNRAEAGAKGMGVGAALGGLFGLIPGVTSRASQTTAGQAIGKGVGKVADVAADAADALSRKAPPGNLSAAAPDGTMVATENLASSMADGLRSYARKMSEGAENAALERIATALTRKQITPEQAMRKLDEIGGPAMLADIAESTRNMGRTVARMPGIGPDLAKEALEARTQGAGGRLLNDVAQNISDEPKYFANVAKAELARGNEGQRLYGAAHETGLPMTEELQGLLQVPAVREALDNTVAALVNTRAPNAPPITPIEVAQKVKQVMNANAEKAYGPGFHPLKKEVGDLATAFEQALYKSNPAMQTADEAYAAASRIPEAMETGRRLFARGVNDAADAVHPEVLGPKVAGMSEGERQGLRVGAAQLSRGIIEGGKHGPRQFASQIADVPLNQKKLAAFLTDGELQGITKGARRELTFAETSNKVLGGSSTAGEAAHMAEMLGGPWAAPQLPSMKAATVRALGDIATKVFGPNESTRDAIARLLLTPRDQLDPQLAQKLERILAGRAAATRQSAIAGGAASNAAAGMTSP